VISLYGTNSPAAAQQRQPVQLEHSGGAGVKTAPPWLEAEPRHPAQILFLAIGRTIADVDFPPRRSTPRPPAGCASVPFGLERRVDPAQTIGSLPPFLRRNSAAIFSPRRSASRSSS
jgi:hypothetical protein